MVSVGILDVVVVVVVASSGCKVTDDMVRRVEMFISMRR